MLSIQAIRSRINGIDKTKQITRSMRLVSFSKAQKAKAFFDTCLPHYQHTLRLMDTLAATYIGRRHPYFAQQEPKNPVVLVFSTDRGLCGAYNMNLARQTLALVREQNARVITVGGKVHSALRREKAPLISNYIGLSEAPVFEEAQLFAAQLMELIEKGEADGLYVVYTRFTSLLEQHATVQRLLPYTPSESSPAPGSWMVEPGEEEMIHHAVPDYVAAVLYKCMAEAAVSEQSARVNSMDAAARNSDELVEKLTLQYNQMRQAGITNQIIEIMGGAAAAQK